MCFIEYIILVLVIKEIILIKISIKKYRMSFLWILNEVYGKVLLIDKMKCLEYIIESVKWFVSYMLRNFFLSNLVQNILAEFVPIYVTHPVSTISIPFLQYNIQVFVLYLFYSFVDCVTQIFWYKII